jgi:hypothetical protein
VAPLSSAAAAAGQSDAAADTGNVAVTAPSAGADQAASAAVVGPPAKIATGATVSYSLSGILGATKGKTGYQSGESFLLHVFWQTPSMAAAHELLAALQRCAVATHHNTPCVPTYFFRLTTNDFELCAPTPQRVADHPQIQQAKKKIEIGIPLAAVHADFVRRGYSLSLLDLADDAPLPDELRSAAGATLECTEIYLDERAMMEHAGSRDYLDAYGAVLQPKLTRGQPQTVRLGTPTQHLQERMLEPILRERVATVPQRCAVWSHTPQLAASRSAAPDVTVADQDAASASASVKPPLLGMPGAVFASLDVDGQAGDADGDDGAGAAVVAAALPSSFLSLCTTCVAFPHCLRPRTIRILAVLPALPSPTVVAELLAAVAVARGEMHVAGATGAENERIRRMVTEAGPGGDLILINVSECSGYVLHQRAAEIHVETRESQAGHSEGGQEGTVAGDAEAVAAATV